MTDRGQSRDLHLSRHPAGEDGGRPEREGGEPSGAPNSEEPAPVERSSSAEAAAREQRSREDRALVEASLKGDLTAFESLVGRYQKSIFSIAHYKCRNYFDAEDLSQEIFLAAFKALPSLKDLDNFGGWLFGIAHNRANKWYQRQRTKIIKFQELQRRKAEEGFPGPPEIQEGPDPSQVLSESLQKLPPEVRQVLVLKYLEGQSYHAIEERMGINAHRIDYLIRKGKEMLRQKMACSSRTV